MNAADFEEIIERFIRDNRLIVPDAGVLLAVSGGADSIALLNVLYSLKEKGFCAGKLVCAHINHQLRGLDSVRDEEFVKAEASRLNLPVLTQRIDVKGFASANKVSIETAARQLRSKCLMEMAHRENIFLIATGHHKDDNCETVIQRLSRGTSFRGLCGIWPKKDFGEITFIRPLLIMNRLQIMEYLKSKNLTWCDDYTNIDCKYRRNFIRHQLIPLLQKECTYSIAELTFNLSLYTRQFYKAVSIVADDVWKTACNFKEENVVIDLEIFQTQHPAIKAELVRRSLERVRCPEGNITEQHYKKIFQLAQEQKNGGKIELPEGFSVWQEYKRLIFSQCKENYTEDTFENISAEITVPGKTKFSNFLIEATIHNAQNYQIKLDKNRFEELFDFDKLKLPLMIRKRRTGDKFIPLGQAEEKRIGKFLTAAKVSQALRQKSVLVIDSEKIIWIWPIRMSQECKITENTKTILCIKITVADK